MNINRNLLRQIIVDRLEVVKKLDVVSRDIEVVDKLPLVLVGVRRGGKSFYLYQTMFDLIAQGHTWDEFLYINFEDERLVDFELSDFNVLLEVFYSLSENEPILFLDEIQNIEGWEKFARRIADEKKRVFITGSNASMLSKEIESTLGGRYISRYIFPYSFKEFLRSKNYDWNQRSLYLSETQGQLISLFDEYLEYGGFPEVVDLIGKRDYLSSIFNKIFLGDVVVRNKVVNVKALELLVKKIAESVRQPISYTRLTNIIKSTGMSISKTTLISYVDYLIESFMLFSIENYGLKLSDRVANPKYYFIDNGLLNLFLYDSRPALLENIVAIALIRKYKHDDVYFYEDLNSEIDFFVESKSMLVQVCYSLTNEKTRLREVDSIVNFNKLVTAERNIILTFEDNEEIVQEDGVKIEVMPVYKWLLE